MIKALPMQIQLGQRLCCSCASCSAQNSTMPSNMADCRNTSLPATGRIPEVLVLIAAAD